MTDQLTVTLEVVNWKDIPVDKRAYILRHIAVGASSMARDFVIAFNPALAML